MSNIKIKRINIDIIMHKLVVVMSLKTLIVIRKTSAGLSCTSFEEKHAFKWPHLTAHNNAYFSSRCSSSVLC